MTPGEFAAKWRGVSTGEQASAQSHFGDLCRMLGEPTPSDADPTGTWYAFEKGAEKLDGHDGFADVWKRERFAWEYKGKRRDLKAAYLQLVGYKDALENPPLLVVSELTPRSPARSGTVPRASESSARRLIREPQLFLRR